MKNIRLRIFLIIILLISFLLAIRIIFLSAVKPEKYKIIEGNSYTVRRGEILDRNNQLLAVSDELESVYANPKEIKDKEKTANELSKILGMDKNLVLTKLRVKKDFIWIKRKINPLKAKKLRNCHITGIGFTDEYKRFYPNKNIGAHILGFCNIDGVGAEGLEKSMDYYLRPDLSASNSYVVKGSDIVLTIDSNVQTFSDNFLKKAIIRENADSGSLILINGKTGEIICMSNYPDFDPNYYRNYPQEVFRNYTIFNQFEPGSVFKIFSVAALLNSGYLNDSDYFYCDGIYDAHGINIKCTGYHKSINYFGILKYSCNDAMLQASENISASELHSYIKDFGFGQRTAINLPGEQPGILRDLKDWNFRSKFSVSIGQEISVNSLQIVKAATAFVNDGIIVEPHIVKLVIDNSKNVVYKKTRKQVNRVLKPGISAKILDAMYTATEYGGTVDDLNVEGLKFAAKSGTGQIYDPVTKKYSVEQLTSSVLTIFPYENPQYIAYVVFHKPKGEIKWGGVIGSRLLNNFLTNIAVYLDIYPNYYHTISEDNIIVDENKHRINSLPALMPDLTGYNSADAVDIFSRTKIKIKVKGTGLVSKQSPAPGTTITENTVIEFYLTVP